jgi:hypothetical protein
MNPGSNAMKRAALILMTLLFAAIAVSPAEARGKAFCKRYAEDVASHRANAGNVLVGTVFGAAAGAILGGAIDGRSGAGKGALLGGVGGTMVGAANTSEKWRRVYRRAYADCRAS